LLGYSSIANGGFLVVALSTMSKAGAASVLFYLAGYLFAVMAAFLVASVVVERLGQDDFSALSGLHRRSPVLAASLALSMVSLAGVPPLAGFFGKFAILRALVEQGASYPAYFAIAAVAIAGVVISFWYYFGVIRAMYWGTEGTDLTPVVVSPTVRAGLVLCVLGIVGLGVFPGAVWDAAVAAVAGFKV
jgi:NADH-quinone oxidoreductase subunit N